MKEIESLGRIKASHRPLGILHIKATAQHAHKSRTVSDKRHRFAT